ncbi:MAG TPA: helix-turn-helix transcriptional regulator [Methylibium sp.]
MHDTAARRPAAGDYLRAWRQRRHMSQLEFALEAEVSQRHLSFLETGRSVPSREMLIRLAERLEVPLRDRNAMLIAAGYAPIYAERPLADPAMAAARQAIELVLKGHEPYPALAIDRHWHLQAANAALGPLLAGVKDKSLLEPPVNVLRLSLHPQGLASRIANLAEWRCHLLDRLRRQIAVTADPVLVDLLKELNAYPASAGDAVAQDAPSDHGGVLVPLELVTDAGLLSFISTTTVFGTPRDITLSELAVEAFFPTNDATAEILRRLGTTEAAAAA